MLIIFDDVVAELKKLQHDVKLTGLFFNRRHLLNKNGNDTGCISILITTQKYVVCPPRIRATLTSLMFFPISKQDYRKIKEEHFDSSCGKMVDLYIEQTFAEKPHNFVYWRSDNARLYKCFSEKMTNQNSIGGLASAEKAHDQLKEWGMTQMN